MPVPRRPWPTVLVAVCIVSLCANVLLARALLGAFGELQFARIFPGGYATGGDRTASPEAPFLAVYGDSRAYLWDLESLRVPGPIANMAHGGQTSAQLLVQLRAEGTPRSTWALVQIGINDLHPIGALPAYRDRIMTSLERNLPAIATQLLARSEYVVFTTIVAPGPVPLGRRLVWDEETPAYVRRANTAIRALAAREPRIKVLDAYALLERDGDYLASRYVDPDFFLHLNATGYAVLNRSLAQILGQPVASAPGTPR